MYTWILQVFKKLEMCAIPPPPKNDSDSNIVK